MAEFTHSLAKDAQTSSRANAAIVSLTIVTAGCTHVVGAGREAAEAGARWRKIGAKEQQLAVYMGAERGKLTHSVRCNALGDGSGDPRPKGVARCEASAFASMGFVPSRALGCINVSILALVRSLLQLQAYTPPATGRPGCRRRTGRKPTAPSPRLKQFLFQHSTQAPARLSNAHDC